MIPCLQDGSVHNRVFILLELIDNPPDIHIDQPNLNNFSLRFSFWVILGCVKLKVKANYLLKLYAAFLLLLLLWTKCMLSTSVLKPLYLI